jgi:archaellum component FlaG (FlaF/FlaG flagellin family)
MKKIIFLASLIMSASVFATTNSVTSHTSLATDAYTNKQQAYDAAFDLVDELKAMNSTQLETTLPISENNVITPSIKLNDITVSIDQFARSPNDIQYQATLDIDYQYKFRESGNH